MECILVDDASPDNSIDIARDTINTYTGKIEFRILRHKENKGLSGARNTGIRHATGNYIYLLDSDDEITPVCIAALTELAAKHPDTDIVQGNLVVTDPLYQWFETSQHHFPEYTTDRQWIQTHMLRDIPVTAWNKLIRTTFITTNNLWFKEGLLHEDEHWKYLSYRHIRSMAFCNEPSYIYYRNEGSITELRFKDRNFQSLLKIYREFLPTFTDADSYCTEATYLLELPRRLDQLADPNRFMADFNNVISEQIKSPTVPSAVKPALFMVTHKARWLKPFCRIFHRPSYRCIKHLKPYLK